MAFDAKAETVGSSPTGGSSESRRERTSIWPRPPGRFVGTRDGVKRRVDRQLRIVADAIYIEMARRGVLPDYEGKAE